MNCTPTILCPKAEKENEPTEAPAGSDATTPEVSETEPEGTLGPIVRVLGEILGKLRKPGG